MELLNVAILCMMAGVGAVGAMESEAAMREHVLDTANERNRYESITINKPVMRFDYNRARQPSPVALSQQGDIQTDDAQDDGHVRQFDDDITGPPSASVRCFCNLPSCISTGYMCKSHFGGCFSDLFQQHPPASAAKTVYRGRHGCIELLTDKAQRERCQRLPNGNRYPASARSASTAGGFKSDEYDHPRSLVHCCHEDMCNHADNPQTKDLINDTTLSDVDETRVIGSPGYSDSDVWFKAATIAVPICGAVILFVLIALAMHLLKSESLNNTNYKLGCTYLHRKHGHNCRKHHDQPYCQPVAAEPFLRKGLVVHEHPDMAFVPPPPGPIRITKNINERFNATNDKQYNYNLLPVRNNNDVRVHEMSPKCYDNKVSTAFGSLPPPSQSLSYVVCDENHPEEREWKPNNLTSSAAHEDACDISLPKNANITHEETHPKP